MEKIRCGGSYCEKCKKCISPPRLRKNYQSEWYTICKECEPNILHVTFIPSEDSITTDFKIDFKDIPKLIKHLEYAHENRYETKHETR